jgi:hypothetical protein
MATVSGVPVENISSIKGVAATSISYIVGVSTSNIPGWPGSAPSCTTVYYGYSDGRRSPITDACTNLPQPYDYNSTTGELYLAGQCGVTYADGGYYSSGGAIYFFDGSTLQFYDMCPR